jgi:hypothetical protein
MEPMITFTWTNHGTVMILLDMFDQSSVYQMSAPHHARMMLTNPSQESHTTNTRPNKIHGFVAADPAKWSQRGRHGEDKLMSRQVVLEFQAYSVLLERTGRCFELPLEVSRDATLTCHMNVPPNINQKP